MQTIGALAPSPERLLSEPTNSPQELAFTTMMAAKLFGSYPSAKAHDPEVFTGAVVRLFLSYDRAVVASVVASLPRTPNKDWDGLPSIATITKALDVVADRVAHNRERGARIAKQFAEREDAQRLAAEQAATGERDRVASGLAGLRSGLSEGLQPIEQEQRERTERRAALLDRANQHVFAKECAAAGIDPSSGVSPSLRKLLTGGKPS
jgi:hypothetical protein